MNLTKELKDRCNENIKTMRKEIEKDTRRWEDLRGHTYLDALFLLGACHSTGKAYAHSQRRKGVPSVG